MTNPRSNPGTRPFEGLSVFDGSNHALLAAVPMPAAAVAVDAGAGRLYVEAPGDNLRVTCTLRAPAGPAVLTFLLSVADDDGASAADGVTVTVRRELDAEVSMVARPPSSQRRAAPPTSTPSVRASAMSAPRPSRSIARPTYASTCPRQPGCRESISRAR